MKKNHNKTINFLNLPSIPSIEAVSGTNISNNFKRHIHKTFILGQVTEGERVISLQETNTIIGKGEIFLINPDQVHSCSSVHQQGHSYQLLSVQAETMQLISNQISEKEVGKPYFTRAKYNDPELTRNLTEIFKSIQESTTESENLIVSFLSNLVIKYAKLSHLVNSTVEQTESVKRVCKYIAHNYSKKLSLGHLSQIACLSPFHFQRVFTKTMGISPHDFLTHFRISEAKRMLLKSQDITDIAIETGFADQSHFTKTFYKNIGIQPGKYLASNCPNNAFNPTREQLRFFDVDSTP